MELPLLKIFLRSYLLIEPGGDVLNAVKEYYHERGSGPLIDLGKEVQELIFLPFEDLNNLYKTGDLSITEDNPMKRQKLLRDIFTHIRSVAKQKWFL